MHMALYNAFKWTPPQFGHVPLLVEKSGQKLSKRNADIDLSSFKDKQGVFAASLVNFASLLGWSHSQKSDVFDLQELEQIVCTHRMKPQVMLLTIPLVQPENHSRQHCCCF
jgi:glutamyl-tRNA synthetase